MDNKIAFVELKPATQKGKKYQAIFYNKGEKKLQTLAFGASGASDFTIHKDPKRKDRYIERHKDREDWSVPNTRGSLSRFLLWNKPTLKASFSDYLKRFNLKKLSK
tara:strand:- start:102 stop:419 length:318 start_codon:yes stop_codon:yes gene_type:complete